MKLKVHFLKVARVVTLAPHEVHPYHSTERRYLRVYTCFVYLQPFCVTLDFKLFIDPIHILFLLYLLLWFGDFTIKNLQHFIKVYRALIKDIFLVAEANPVNLSNRLLAEAQEKKH